MTSKYLLIIMLLAMLFAFALMGIGIAHGATTSKNVSNSLGAVPYQSNPYMYLAGSLVHNGTVFTDVNGNLNVRINPLGTYLLYDESILFCGLPIEKFRNITEPFVLVFRRQAHRAIDGIGCHELVAVFNVVPQKQ